MTDYDRLQKVYETGVKLLSSLPLMAAKCLPFKTKVSGANVPEPPSDSDGSIACHNVLTAVASTSWGTGDSSAMN